MAEFTFNCPQCGQRIEADESSRGQGAECPHCGKGIVVPCSEPDATVEQQMPHKGEIRLENTSLDARRQKLQRMMREAKKKKEEVLRMMHQKQKEALQRKREAEENAKQVKAQQELEARQMSGVGGKAGKERQEEKVLPMITSRERESLIDRCTKWLKAVGIGMAVLLLFAVVVRLTSGSGKEEDTVDATIANESLIDRLRRLKFDVSVNDKGCMVVSDTGVDEPVFITEDCGRAASKDNCVTVFKPFGPWFVRDSETVYKIKRLKGWNAVFGDSRYTFIYLVRIRNRVSDKNLTAAIYDVKRKSFPFSIDEKYQTRWSILYTMQCLLKCVENGSNKKWQAMVASLKLCPVDFQKAMTDLLAAVPGQQEDMVTAGGNLGEWIGSMNEDNPLGGAIVGGILGAIVGAATQEAAIKEQERVFNAKLADLLNVARNYGADLKDLSDAPFGWDKL